MQQQKQITGPMLKNALLRAVRTRTAQLEDTADMPAVQTGPLQAVQTARCEVFQLCIVNPALSLTEQDRRMLLNSLALVYKGKVLPGQGGFFRVGELFLHPTETWRVMTRAYPAGEVHS